VCLIVSSGRWYHRLETIGKTKGGHYLAIIGAATSQADAYLFLSPISQKRQSCAVAWLVALDDGCQVLARQYLLIVHCQDQITPLYASLGGRATGHDAYDQGG
jgi:hypothetical protein